MLPNNIDLDGVLTEFKPSEVFIEPIEFKGVNLGVLVAATGAHPSDERTEQLIQLFSRSLGLALNNAMIHSKFQKLAAVDGLTNVYNRRFGMERLKEDFSRSVRDRSNLSLAMVDIDHFKKVNDTYGHLVGDKVIVLIAAIIKKALRDGDIVVRYGGEEFLLVLHGASCGDAEVVCERIRHQVNDTIFKDGDQQIDLTVSIGLVSYPEQMSGNEVELLDKADQALYHGKQTGRNKVVRYGALKAGAK
jgi:two-component system, cell cycle response regulator